MTNTQESVTDTTVTQTETTETNQEATQQPETTDNSNEGKTEKKGSKGVEKLLAQRNELKGDVESLTKQVEQLKLENELTKAGAKYGQGAVDDIANIAAERGIDVETAGLVWRGMNPVATEQPQPAKPNPNQFGMGGSTNNTPDRKTITAEQFSQLSQAEFDAMDDKIASGEVTLVN